MKSAGLKIMFMAFLALVMYSFTYLKEGGIKGTVTPKEAVSAVYAINGTDTFASTYVEGSFMFTSLKKGNYTLLFKGIEPYKDAVLSNIEVADSVVTDVGEIKMQP
ncbi:MAG: carboxypeptidase regulatory-like domain-containing protein [Pedobacter sp.]|nr:MAG: carboxypeptidase regulatory-like domain-containing protein [Pedobacter sp.]